MTGIELTTLESKIKWLNDRRQYLKISVIATYVGMDQSNLTKILNSYPKAGFPTDKEAKLDEFITFITTLTQS